MDIKPDVHSYGEWLAQNIGSTRLERRIMMKYFLTKNNLY